MAKIRITSVRCQSNVGQKNIPAISPLDSLSFGQGQHPRWLNGFPPAKTREPTYHIITIHVIVCCFRFFMFTFWRTEIYLIDKQQKRSNQRTTTKPSYQPVSHKFHSPHNWVATMWCTSISRALQKIHSFVEKFLKRTLIQERSIWEGT